MTESAEKVFEPREESVSGDNVSSPAMRAVRIHEFGGVEVIVDEELPRPIPAQGQVLVRVKAAGVGPWDAWIRNGKSVLPQPLPLTLGSDLSGVVESVGPGVSGVQRGDEVYGVTNARFTGAWADYAIAEAAMIAPKPERLTYVEAASVPVVASTAWQMVFDHGQVDETKRVLVQGGAGNVGSYAVQLAKWAGAEVVATARTDDVDYVYTLGADRVIDTNTMRFEEEVTDSDVVIDTIGGDVIDRSFAVLRSGGVLVSAVGPPDQDKATQRGVRAVFILVAVSSGGLMRIGELFDAYQLRTNVGEVLPLYDARLAHEMLAGKPHRPGKIVLSVDK